MDDEAFCTVFKKSPIKRAKLARELLAMSPTEFSAAFKGSPMKRAKRRGLARNAAVALGNVGTADDLPALEAALQHDEPLVSEHAVWALGRPRHLSFGEERSC